MEIQQETIRYDRMRHFCMRITKIEYMASHTHGSYELSYVLQGKGVCTIGMETIQLTPGQLILVNPYEVHSFTAEGQESLVLLTAQFHRLFLRRYIERIPKLRFSAGSIEALSYSQYKELEFLLTKTAAVYFSESESYQFRVLGCGVFLLGKLVADLEWELDDTMDGAEKEHQQNRVQRLTSYIDENFRQKITLAQLAEMEGISTTHLSHFFRKAFGMTFQAYLSNQRMEKALVLLRDESVPLSEIYMRCGFSDQRYLDAACQKAFGYSAEEYRRRYETVDRVRRRETEDQTYSVYSWEESLFALEQYLGTEKYSELI